MQRRIIGYYTNCLVSHNIGLFHIVSKNSNEANFYNSHTAFVKFKTV